MLRRAARLDGLGTTIFTEMTALAQRTGAINLGQGFPDEDGPAPVIEAAVAGAARRREPVRAAARGAGAARGGARASAPYYGLEPEDVLVTFGATEGIAAALLALCEPGDEVVVLEPYYDSYAACIAFSGAARRPVTLRPPSFALDRDALRACDRATRAADAGQLPPQPHRPRARPRGAVLRSPRPASSTTWCA